MTREQLIKNAHEVLTQHVEEVKWIIESLVRSGAVDAESECEHSYSLAKAVAKAAIDKASSQIRLDSQGKEDYKNLLHF